MMMYHMSQMGKYSPNSSTILSVLFFLSFCLWITTRREYYFKYNSNWLGKARRGKKKKNHIYSNSAMCLINVRYIWTKMDPESTVKSLTVDINIQTETYTHTNTNRKLTNFKWQNRIFVTDRPQSQNIYSTIENQTTIFISSQHKKNKSKC